MSHSDFHVYWTEGDWRVVNFKYTGGNFDYVEHECPEVKLNRDPKVPHWTGYRYTYSSFHLPCRKCGELVPEVVQTMYVLLTGDMDVNAESWLTAGEVPS